MSNPVVVLVEADLLLVQELLAAGRRVLADVPGSDLAALDLLARLTLLGQRSGDDLDLRCSPELAELAVLCGLQVRRQTEALEDRDVEEVVDVGDPPG